MKRKFQNIGVSPLTGKTVIISSQSFFHRLFECPKNNLEPLTRRQLHPPDVNHFAFTYSTRGSVGASRWGWVPKTGRTHQWNSNRVPSGFKTDELSHCVTFQNYFREPRQSLLYFNLHNLFVAQLLPLQISPSLLKASLNLNLDSRELFYQITQTFIEQNHHLKLQTFNLGGIRQNDNYHIEIQNNAPFT